MKLTAPKKAPPTTAISHVCAITCCSCSTSLAIWNGVPCGLGTCIALMAGRTVLEPVIARYRNKMKGRYFRGDAAFANPEVYELWRPRATNTPSGCRPTRSYRNSSAGC